MHLLNKFFLGFLFFPLLSWATDSSQDTSGLLNELGGSEEAIRKQFGSTEMAQASAEQTRFFPKTYRHQLSLKVGSAVYGEPYLDTQELGGSYRFYINEWLGFGPTFMKRFGQVNKNFNTLSQMNSQPPVVGPRFSYGMDVVVTPFYAKMNLFDWKILRLEVFLEAGYHRLHTDVAAQHAFYSGGGLRVLPTKWMSFSFALSNYFYKEVRRFAKDDLKDVISFQGQASFWLPFNG